MWLSHIFRRKKENLITKECVKVNSHDLTDEDKEMIKEQINKNFYYSLNYYTNDNTSILNVYYHMNFGRIKTIERYQKIIEFINSLDYRIVKIDSFNDSKYIGMCTIRLVACREEILSKEIDYSFSRYTQQRPVLSSCTRIT